MKPEVKTNDSAEQIVNVQSMRMLAQTRAGTFNEEANTVEVVAATGVQVLRYGWDGPYMEELGMQPGNVRIDRLASGKAPVLDSHQSYELENVIGVVDSARLEGGQIIATLRFSNRDEVKPYTQDIKDGILRNVSIGYQVYRYELVSGGDTETPVYRATDWEPFEISVVPVPADAGAGMRAETENQKNRCTIHGARSLVKERNITMEDEVLTPAAGENTPAAPAAPTAPVVDASEAVKAERARAAEINKMVRSAKLPASMADDMISKGVTLDAARAAVLDKLADASDAAPTVSRVQVVREAEDSRSMAIEAALFARSNPGKTLPGVTTEAAERAREFRGMSLLEIARESVERSGVSTKGMSKMELAGRGLHSTSDFPIILANVANKTLRSAYNESPQTFRPLVRVTSASDFKQITRAQLGEAPMLTPVGENGEFQRGTIGESKEVYNLATYGKIVGITRQVIINDDLDAFSRVPAAFGRQAANLESDLVWGTILANAAMGDGVALFHANHGNLGTGAGSALTSADLTSLNATRSRMRMMKGLDGTTLLNLVPNYLIVPTTLETIAEKIVSPIQPNTADTVNTYAGKLQLIVEPRLNAGSTTAWYAAAAGQVDLIELAYLDGEQGPQFETRNGFDVDGVEIKVRMDVAAKVIDHRGLQKNNGA